jgi:transcriptional regulator with PAS, ATPase and Fis domain
LQGYLPALNSQNLPALFLSRSEGAFTNEREILYKVIFDMKRDMNDLKKLVLELMEGNEGVVTGDKAGIIHNLYNEENVTQPPGEPSAKTFQLHHIHKDSIQDTEEVVEESLSLEENEIELIEKALEKHNGKRKYAAEELGISERTLYRKIKEYNINR